MDESRVGRWLAVGANVGVLFGLLLVVLQLQQNREFTRAQIRHEIAMGIVDQLQEQSGNSQLVGVIRRGSVGEELTADELLQFQMRSNALLRYWENVHYQYRHGLYDEVEFARHRAAWGRSLAGNKGMVQYWCENRDLYSPPFRDDLDSVLTVYKC